MTLPRETGNKLGLVDVSISPAFLGSNMKKMFGLLMFVSVICSGCTVTRITSPTWELKRTSFLQKTEIPKVSIQPDGTAVLEGYKNDGGNEAAALITAAAVSAAVKSASPLP